MAKAKLNIQDQFLNNLRREKAQVTVRLTSGEEVEGVVKAFDNFCVVVKTPGNYLLLYKHAIAYIRPFEPLKKFDAIYENF
ncbi:RNA chaperone Hfq [Deferrisoma camini]|uniref:RNA chaperone Hfq n=1 Tax=Deferrisoma camini TaxID=1035120 RepID=UPI00046D6ED9|nr:RNA chaperone Hfq [Deferrisoma camini]